MGFLSLLWTCQNANGMWPADMSASTDGAVVPTVKMNRPVAPGPWRLIRVDYRYRKDGTAESNADIEQHRGVYIRLRGDMGRLLFQHGGVMDAKRATFLPSSIIAHQTHHRVGTDGDAFRGYQEDAVFYSDQAVSNVDVELYDTQTGERVKDGFLHLSLDFQTPEYIL